MSLTGNSPGTIASPVNTYFKALGQGAAMAHHGEILQGVFEYDGRLHRGLVTLPCPLFHSKVFFTPQKSGVTVQPYHKQKSLTAAKLIIKGLTGGKLIIKSDIPVKWGLGSSTSDITATARAIADSLQTELSSEQIARIAVTAETASDSIMFDNNAVLFAHREGIVLEDLGGKLPTLDVIGFNTDLTKQGVDTLSLSPARYDWKQIEAFRPLLGLLRQAIRTQDSHLVARIASASARINQSFLPLPLFKKIELLAKKTGAIGMQTAHSGTIVGLLYDPRVTDLENRVQRALAVLRELGIKDLWHFRTCS